MVRTVEEVDEGRIESLVDSTIENIDKLPSKGNVDVMALSAFQGLFAGNMMLEKEGSNVFRPPNDPEEYYTISQRAEEQLGHNRGLDSDSNIEKVQAMSSWLPAAGAGIIAKPAAVGAGIYTYPEVGMLFLMALPVAPMMPDPLETAIYAESELLKEENNDIEIDYENLRQALENNQEIDNLFEGEVYRPEWSSYETLHKADGEIQLYSSTIEEEVSRENLEQILEDETLEWEYDNPLMFEKPTGDRIEGKVIIPAYYQDQTDGDRVYAKTPAIEINYQRRNIDSQLPAKTEHYNQPPTEESEEPLNALIEELEA